MKRIKQINNIVIFECDGKFLCKNNGVAYEQFDNINKCILWCTKTLDFVNKTEHNKQTKL